MKQEKNRLKKRIPIRRRFLTTVLLTTVISILAVSATGLFSIRRVRRSMEVTLTEQLENNLKKTIQEKVSTLDARLDHYEDYITFIKDSIELLDADREQMIAEGVMVEPPTDTSEYEFTRAFASADNSAEELQEEILFYSNLGRIWEPIAKENRALISSIYLGTESGLLLSYDRYSYLSVPPEGKDVVYNYFVSEWYRRGIKTDGTFYTGVYMDFQGRGLTITIGSAFKDGEGNPAGVVCMDYDLYTMYHQLFSSDLEDGTFIFALDHEGTIISPDSDLLDLKAYTGLSLDELDALRADPDGIMEKNNLIYVCIPMERVGWTLCASMPKDSIQESIHDADQSIKLAVIGFLIVVSLILLSAMIAVNSSVRSITYPLELLGRDIKIISDGNLNYRASVFRNDEIGDITSGMNAMVDRLNFTMNELISSQQQADAMSRLATLDTLTGIRNKTAFDRQIQRLREDMEQGESEFGFAMMDLNNLKMINDNFGHDKGDLAIKKLCHIICEVFRHSPVFRVGGDEFVAVLQKEDYRNAELLVKRFKNRINFIAGDKNAEPWDKVSAAIGYTLYDAHVDSGPESVLARADMAMYNCKKRMKES